MEQNTHTRALARVSCGERETFFFLLFLFRERFLFGEFWERESFEGGGDGDGDAGVGVSAEEGDKKKRTRKKNVSFCSVPPPALSFPSSPFVVLLYFALSLSLALQLAV